METLRNLCNQFMLQDANLKKKKKIKLCGCRNIFETHPRKTDPGL